MNRIAMLSLVTLCLSAPHDLYAQGGAAAGDVRYLPGDVEVGDKSYPYIVLPPLEVVEGKEYPLFLFLHGAGERGSDNERQKGHFPNRMSSEWYRERFPCYVLAPQCPKQVKWADVAYGNPQNKPEPSDPMRAAIAALKEVVRDHPIDMDRIMLTGLSMGGYGTFDLASRHPGWFAAAAAVCGGASPKLAPRYAGLPMHVWHGDDDRVINVERSRVMVRAMKELGLEVHYTELPGVRHNSWDNAYGKDGCIDELFQARRDPMKIQRATAKLLADVIAPDERVAFLGDSITQGGNNPGGYVDLVRQVLKEQKPDSVVIPAGISGHKVPDLLKRFKRDVMDKGATLVFIYIGINDVWHSTSGNGTPAEEFEAGLHTLIKDLRASGADVVLATPSVIGEKPHGENSLDAMLTEYAAISRKVAAAEGVVLCDLQRAFHEHLGVFNPEDKDKGILTNDGVHLNKEGNIFLATEAARALREAVMKR
ncbi:MAG: GDSL-type esterase/lipase family protein [Planctomycetes bacterium]|nr:GDSL-type esterase/lipase family protein [Planctomycetota bacterium]